MATVLAQASKNANAAIYFGHADGALTSKSYLSTTTCIRKPYSLEEFASILNVHLLLYERLIIPDDFMLHNPLLRQVLVDDYDNPRPHHIFLKDGSIIPALRDSIRPSFVSLVEHFAENRTYGHPPFQRIVGYAEALDSLAHRATFYSDEARHEVMASTVDHFLSNEHFLTKVRLRILAQDVRTAALRAARSKRSIDYPDRRSWFFELADQLAPRSATRAENLRLFSSAALNFAITHVLDLVPSYPMPIARMIIPMHQTCHPDEQSATNNSSRYFQATIEQRINVAPSQFASLRPEVIQEIRKKRFFRSYLLKFRQAQLIENCTIADMVMKDALNEYILELRDFLALELTGSRDIFKRLQSAYRWLVGTSSIMGIASGGVGLIVPMPRPMGATLSVMGLAWGVVGATAPEWLKKKMESEVKGANKKLLAGPSATRTGLVQIGGVGGMAPHGTSQQFTSGEV